MDNHEKYEGQPRITYGYVILGTSDLCETRGIRMERASREGVWVCQGVKFAEMDREEI